MDKRQFVEQMIEQVRSLPISQVVGDYMELIPYGRHHKGLCPFHPDNKMGSFFVTNDKGVFKCFSCGEGGDAIRFAAQMENKNYLEAAFRLALRFGVISYSEYEEYFERRRFSRDEVKRIERKYQELDKKKTSNHIADEKTRHEVFSMLLSLCELSQEHREHLIKERGLGEEDIREGGYFTFPTRRKMAALTELLKKKFGDLSVLERIPGFYKEKLTGCYSFARHKGIGIPIRNAKGEIVGLQIRHDEKREGMSRYVWFSSSFAMFSDKYEGGTSSGAPVDVVFPQEITNTTVFVTEGRFKAHHLAKQTGSIALSVQGVCSWKNILIELERISFSPITKERYKKGNYRPFCVFAAFDADMFTKYEVFVQLKNMTDAIEQKGWFVYYLLWDEHLGKGIDDVILNGNLSHVKRFDKQQIDLAVEKLMQALLQEHGVRHIKDLPRESVALGFKKEILTLCPLKKKELSDRHYQYLQRHVG
ncbi:UNVERIFIED_ORG: uncharacterized protein DUF3854 [Anoxybacillus amylolyticus]